MASLDVIRVVVQTDAFQGLDDDDGRTLAYRLEALPFVVNADWIECKVTIRCSGQTDLDAKMAVLRRHLSESIADGELGYFKHPGWAPAYKPGSYRFADELVLSAPDKVE